MPSNISISTRLGAFFLPILMGSIILITFLSNNITKEIIVEKKSQSVKHDLELIAANVENLLAEAESCADAFILNVNNIDHFWKIRQAPMQDIQNISRALFHSTILFEKIKETSFINNEGDYVTSILSKDIYRVGNIASSDFFRSIRSIHDTCGWISTHKKAVLAADPNEQNLTFVKRVRDIATSRDMGYIVLNISEEHFFSIYRNISSSENIICKIIDDDSIILSSVERQELTERLDSRIIEILEREQEARDIELRGQAIILARTPVKTVPWTIITLIPLDELTRDVDKMTGTLIATGGIVFLLAFLSTIILSRTITRPLTELSNHMKNLEDGSLHKHKEINRGDEIGVLNKSFNMMIDRNRNLLMRIDEKEKKKREYELALLQSQIKPHFLYNTLDSIGRLAGLHRMKELVKTTRNIADFYRIALSAGDEIIPIQKEIELVEKYLYIQRIRYPDIFEFEMELSPQLLNYRIPKFTIQPIVENAIYHGLRSNKTKGIIRIIGYHQGNGIVLEISDNGVGIDEEKVNEIFEGNTDMGNRKSYGLLNIDERLKLYYGDDYGLEIYSRVRDGSTILLKIGLEEKEISYV